MEVVIKWAKIERKKKRLDDVSLVLLIETIIMEISYLLEKLDIKKIRKFFKMFRNYILSKNVLPHIGNMVPDKRDLNVDDNMTKKELYRLFNYYVPLLRIFETDMSSSKKFRDTETYKKILKYVTSSEMID
jgi:hypothetical protein